MGCGRVCCSANTAGLVRCRDRFDDLRGILLRLGFAKRVKGSHHIFAREGIAEILNLQPRGSMAKPYQVKQVQKVLVQYKLAEED
jgi:hypothetical protein